MAGRASLAYSLKYCIGDLIAQKVIGGSDQSIDRVRAASFLTFGGYYGVVNYTVFRLLQTSPWPVAPWSKALFSAVFDGCVHVPLSFYPQFYFFTGEFEGNKTIEWSLLCGVGQISAQLV